jgi:hypothetical protein
MNNIDAEVFAYRLNNRLNELNNKLEIALVKNGYEPVLLGNLFYDHLQPNFKNSIPNSILQTKRDRLANVARKSTLMLEVGVNGGHSALLSLSANPELQFIGVDIAAFYPPEPRCHPELYVPAAFETLNELFPGRTCAIIGNCIDVLPQYTRQHNTPHIDFLHLDGDKLTYEADFYNILPCLKKGAYVVFDDTQNPNVQRIVDKLLSIGIVERSEFPPMSLSEIYRHEIVRLV